MFRKKLQLTFVVVTVDGVFVDDLIDLIYISVPAEAGKNSLSVFSEEKKIQLTVMVVTVDAVFVADLVDLIYISVVRLESILPFLLRKKEKRKRFDCLWL